jgi:hypothetical protein
VVSAREVVARIAVSARRDKRDMVMGCKRQVRWRKIPSADMESEE